MSTLINYWSKTLPSPFGHLGGFWTPVGSYMFQKYSFKAWRSSTWTSVLRWNCIFVRVSVLLYDALTTSLFYGYLCRVTPAVFPRLERFIYFKIWRSSAKTLIIRTAKHRLTTFFGKATKHQPHTRSMGLRSLIRIIHRIWWFRRSHPWPWDCVFRRFAASRFIHTTYRNETSVVIRKLRNLSSMRNVHGPWICRSILLTLLGNVNFARHTVILGD